MAKTLDHVKSYPLVSELIAYLSSFVFISFVFAKLKQLFVTLPSNKYLYKVDAYADDRILTSFDKTFPKVTTITSKDVAAIPKEQLAAVNAKLSASFQSSVKQVKDLYTEKAKPKLDGTLNPIIEPANNKLESLLSSYLPGEPTTAAVANDKIPKEVGRTVSIATEAIKRVKPKIDHYKTGLTSHVVETYQAENSSVLNTALKLSKEAFETIKPGPETIDAAVQPVEAVVDSAAESAAKATEQVVNGFK